MRFRCLSLSHYVIGWLCEGTGVGCRLGSFLGVVREYGVLKEYVRTMVLCRYTQLDPCIRIHDQCSSFHLNSSDR